MDKITRAFRRVGRMTEDEARRAASGRPGITRAIARILLRALESMERETVENKPENAIMEPAGDSYENHPGRAGGGSLPRGSSSADLRKRARENPNVRNGLDGDYLDGHAVAPFRKDKLHSHFKEHGGKMGYRNEAEYQKAAMEFLEQPLTETMEELEFPGEYVLRFDHADGKVGCLDVNGNVSTFFDPRLEYKKSTVEYLEEKIDEQRKKRKRRT